MNKLIISAADEQNIKLKRGGEIWEKLIDIRNAHGLGRTLFAREIDSTENTISAMEKKGYNPRTELVQNVCYRWPEYTIWLMIDEISPEIGQINPAIRVSILAKNKFDPKDFTFNRNDEEHVKFALDSAKHLEDLTSPIPVDNPLTQEEIKEIFKALTEQKTTYRLAKKLTKIMGIKIPEIEINENPNTKQKES